jgi:hypothetical protein
MFLIIKIINLNKWWKKNFNYEENNLIKQKIWKEYIFLYKNNNYNN